MPRVKGWLITSISVTAHLSIREKTVLFSEPVTADHARMELLVTNPTTQIIIPAHAHSGSTDETAKKS